MRFAAERKEGLTDALAQGFLDPHRLFAVGSVVGDFVLVLHDENEVAPVSFIDGLRHTEKDQLTQPPVERPLRDRRFG
ncbi:MAG TPA: hypothetical protein VJU34_13095 [Phenylobacterium sp.]|nr:hypothetical protein [Phenylobacterium sp.]